VSQSAKRLPLIISLMLTPDSRWRTRWAIMRAATISERGGFAALTPVRRKRLFRGMASSQKTWVSVGISLYNIARTRPLVLPTLVLSVLYVITSAISRAF
jgi:hypothetical protein